MKARPKRPPYRSTLLVRPCTCGAYPRLACLACRAWQRYCLLVTERCRQAVSAGRPPDMTRLSE